MKVKDLLEQLEAYEPDTELIVAYWDKETVEGYGAPTLSETQWGLVVQAYQDGEWHWQGSAGDDFVEIAEKVVGDE